MPANREQQFQAFTSHGSFFLGLTFIFYPTLSSMQFKGYVCESIDEVRLLSVDLSIDCKSERYQSFLIVNMLLTIVTQSIPLMYFVILFRVRGELYPASKRSPQAQLRDRQKREQGQTLAPLAFLFTHYTLPWWYFEVIESYRRVAFICFLGLIPDKTVAGFTGVVMASLSVSFYRDAKPYHLASSNMLASVANQQIMITYVFALLLRVTDHGNNTAGGLTLIGVNLAIIPFTIHWSKKDYKQRIKDGEIQRKNYEKLKHAEAEDKKKFDIAWAGYTKHAVDTGHATVIPQLEATLQELDATVGSKVVMRLAHPDTLASSIDELMTVATNNNDMMHGVVREIVESMNGLYEQGPLKKKERVQEKAEGDYGGNFLEVIDIVRSSAV